CLRFEDRWRAGQRPHLETQLADFEAEVEAAVLGELLLLEWSYRVRGGEAFYFDEYAQRFATYRPVVERAWERWKEKQSYSTALPANTPAGPTVPPSVFRPGRYEQVRLLGQGGMGEVYKAVDPVLKRPVALKRVRVDRAMPEHLARFRTEAEALARLHHPHIVKVHEFTESNSEPVLVMEFVAGPTLENLLGQRRLTEAEAARLVAILAWTVHAAHQAGVGHRDRKPGKRA